MLAGSRRHAIAKCGLSKIKSGATGVGHSSDGIQMLGQHTALASCCRFAINLLSSFILTLSSKLKMVNPALVHEWLLG